MMKNENDHNEDEKNITNFLEYAEEFKKDPKYQEMPLDMRDFFNEEIGSFKYALEILKKIKKNG